MYKAIYKRLIDVIISGLGLVVLSPLFLLTTTALFFYNHGKPFFFQIRPGKDAKHFKIIKFKTMNDKRSNTGELLPDVERLSKVGSFVRATSIDEIPQLINVLKGDMSIVGPRPLRTYYLPLYSDTQKRRHEVRPGITGWAQVNGRNAISWSKKFEYDVYYVDNISFKLDLKILIKTFYNVIRGKDINASDSIPMERFNGSN